MNEFNPGPVIAVNQFTPGDQRESQIVQLTNGQLIAVWADLDASNYESGDGSGSTIMGRLLNTDGTAAGGEFIINDNSFGNQLLPVVTALSDGGFAVAWTNEGFGSNSSVVMQTFNASGEPTSEETNLFNVNQANNIPSSITQLENGDIVVAGTRATEADTAELDFTFDAVVAIQAAGSENTSVTVVPLTSDLSSSYDVAYEVVALNNGGFVVLMASDVDGGYALRLFDESGAPVGGIMDISDDFSNVIPELQALPDGGFAVIGQVNNGNDGQGLVLQSFDAEGAEITEGPTVLIENFYQNTETAILSDGTIAIVWDSQIYLGDGESSEENLDPGEIAYELIVTTFDPSGATVTPPFAAVPLSDVYLEPTALIALPQGGFGLLWQDQNYEGGEAPRRDTDIFFTAFTSGPSTGNDVRTISENDKYLLVIDVAGNGGPDTVLSSISGISLITSSARLQGLSAEDLAYISIVDDKINFELYEIFDETDPDQTDIDGLQSGETAEFIITYMLADETTQTLTVRVIGTNDSPQMIFYQTGGFPVPEGETLVGQAVFYDADDDIGDVTYSLPVGQSSPADTGRFTIDPVTGIVRFIAATDYENPTDFDQNNIYDLDIIATTTLGISEYLPGLNIVVGDVNEQTGAGPVVSGPVTIDPIDEDSIITITTAQLLANTSDADGDALSIFGLTATDGTLYEQGNGTWDFVPSEEFSGTVNLTYSVTDGLSSVATSASLVVNTVNDPPSSISVGNRTLNDNLDTGDIITQAEVYDVDNDSGFTWELYDNAGGRFGINATTGEIFVADAALLDVTATQSYSVGIRVADPSGSTHTQSFFFTVNDADPAGTDVVPGDTSSTVTVPIDGAVNGAINFAGDRDWYRLELTQGVTYTFATGASTAPITGYTNTDSYLYFYSATGSLFASDDDSGPELYSLLSYTPTTSGTYYIAVADYGDNSPLDFRLTVTSNGGNAAPVVANPLPDITVNEDDLTSITINATNIFSDPNDTMTYSIVNRPSWLSGDTNGLSGTPTNNNVGTYTVIVRATDSSGNQTDDSFTLTVRNVNDTPIISALLPDLSSAEDQTFSLSLPSGSFADVDAGDTLTYTATLADGSALPSWLTFTPNGQVVSGTPPQDFNGIVQIRITATDTAGASVSDVLALTITPVNDAPVAANGSVVVDEDASITNAFPASDVDGDVLSFAILTGPTHGSVVINANGTYTYTPNANYTGTDSFTFRANDGDLNSSAATVNVTVNAVNDAPTLALPLADRSAPEDTVVSFTLPTGTFADIDNEALALTTSTLPGWLSFDAATQTFTGTPPQDFNGNINITVTASDGALSVDDTFTLYVTPVNDTPTLVLAPPTQNSSEDVAFTYIVPVGTFADVDAGDVLTLSASNLPSWLSFDAATGTFSGTPSNGDVGSVSVTLTATDTGNASVSAVLNITVANVNDAPVVQIALQDQSGIEGTAFSFQIPGGNFTDIDQGDTDVLSYSTSALPSWLNFDAATGAFTGTPQDVDVGEVSVTVTATDPSGASVSDTFVITVADVNNAPTVALALVDQTSDEDIAVNFTLPANSFADGDGDTLTLTTSPLPTWLSFDAETRNFTGTPPADFEGNLTISVTASDGQLSVTDAFVLQITTVNDAPTDIALSTATVAENAANGTVVGTATSTDTDAQDSRSFSLVDNAGGRFAIDTTTGAVTIANGSLLNFEAATSHNILVRVTDTAGASYDEAFTIAVTNVNEAPRNLTLTSGGSVAENAANGTIVGQLGATDPDAGAALTYNLVNNADGRFAINTATGQITVANGALLDYETAPSHSLTARVTDQGGLTRDLTFNVTLTDIVETTPPNPINGTNKFNVLLGTNGADIINGRGGRDILIGNGGNDILIGGSGPDILLGGAGQDIFRYLSTTDAPRGAGPFSIINRDNILDFNPNNGANHDIIDLSAIDANINAAGDQAFTFIGNAGFTRSAGQLRFANGILSGDINGDRIADIEIGIYFSVPVTGQPLDLTDFIL